MESCPNTERATPPALMMGWGRGGRGSGGGPSLPSNNNKIINNNNNNNEVMVFCDGSGMVVMAFWLLGGTWEGRKE